MSMRSDEILSKYNECHILVIDNISIELNLYDSQQLNLNYMQYTLIFSAYDHIMWKHCFLSDHRN